MAKKHQNYLRESFGDSGKRKSPRLFPGIKNIILDIDGVVSEDIPNEEPKRMATAFEIPGSREQINKWYKEGHIITFFTSRTDDLERVTKKWLKEHGFKYHNIIFNKPRGGNYYYIDDGEIKASKFNGKFEKLQ